VDGESGHFIAKQVAVLRDDGNKLPPLENARPSTFKFD
jgi:hypothetical protein